ncbi:hypothetical protein CEP51_012788 [Fusarium floridanum]|uniref:Uncharacterized protein n=1 Tax=Fusarium floridanum TaxID=1325733 RepID=A0A428QMX5_9HYPO|nr:hypothetical protein CEP51_012788 [Fusarium floridanum]
MSEDESYQDEEGLGLPPAPTIPPEFARAWLDVVHPENLSIFETVIMSRLQYIAAQVHHLARQVEDLRNAISRGRSRRGSMSSSTTASTKGGDDTSIAPIPSDRVQEAFNELRTRELREILTALHDSFVTVNNKKLHVQRTINANTDATTFIEHVTEVIKEKQANPEGQEVGVAGHYEKMLGYLANLAPDLKMDLYIELNKAKKQRDDPKGQGKAKAKHAGSPILIGTDDSDHQSTTSHAGPSTTVTQNQQASARPSRKASNSSQGNGQPRRHPSRQTSRSDRVKGEQSQQS